MRLHHDWDDEPTPDRSDPASLAALERAARGVRTVKLVHLGLMLVGLSLLGLALLLRVS